MMTLKTDREKKTAAEINSPENKTDKKPELQAASLDIWDKKYRLKDKHGNNQEANVDETFLRIAKALADIEVKDQAQWQEKFLWLCNLVLIQQGALFLMLVQQNLSPRPRQLIVPYPVPLKTP